MLYGNYVTVLFFSSHPNCCFGKSLGIAYQIKDDITDTDVGRSDEILNFLADNSVEEPDLSELIGKYSQNSEQNLKILEPNEPRDLLIDIYGCIEAY